MVYSSLPGFSFSLNDEIGFLLTILSHPLIPKIICLLLIGLIFLIIGYMERYKKCPLPKIEYRYIPRNFYEEQVTENNLKNTFLHFQLLFGFLGFVRQSILVLVLF